MGPNQSESAYACTANQRPRSRTDLFGPECALYKRGWQLRGSDLYSTSTRTLHQDAQTPAANKPAAWPGVYYDTQPIHFSPTDGSFLQGPEQPSFLQQHQLQRRRGLRAAIAASLVSLSHEIHCSTLIVALLALSLENVLCGPSLQSPRELDHHILVKPDMQQDQCLLVREHAHIALTHQGQQTSGT